MRVNHVYEIDYIRLIIVTDFQHMNRFYAQPSWIRLALLTVPNSSLLCIASNPNRNKLQEDFALSRVDLDGWDSIPNLPPGYRQPETRFINYTALLQNLLNSVHYEVLNATFQRVSLSRFITATSFNTKNATWSYDTSIMNNCWCEIEKPVHKFPDKFWQN